MILNNIEKFKIVSDRIKELSLERSQIADSIGISDWEDPMLNLTEEQILKLDQCKEISYRINLLFDEFNRLQDLINNGIIQEE